MWANHKNHSRNQRTLRNPIRTYVGIRWSRTSSSTNLRDHPHDRNHPTKMPTGKSADKDFLWETLLINPEIIATSEELQRSEEACLSLPWEKWFVQRAKRVEVKYMDLKGKIHQQKYSGFNACIIQHEIDHLNGVLFIDKLIKEEKKEKSD